MIFRADGGCCCHPAWGLIRIKMSSNDNDSSVVTVIVDDNDDNAADGDDNDGNAPPYSRCERTGKEE